MPKKLTGFIAATLIAAACGSGATSSARGATPVSGALKLTPPWTGNERFEYDIVESKSGAAAGTGVIEVRPAADVTTIEHTYKLGSVTQHIVIRVQPDTLRPIGGEMAISGTANDFSIQSEYKDGKLMVNAKTANGDKSAAVDVAADALDNDSVLIALRAIPFGNGFSSSFQTVVGANAAQVKTTLTVAGQESVTVPKGTFDTYKVELSFAGTKQTVWYEAAAPHRMIQYDNGTTRFVLTK